MRNNRLEERQAVEDFWGEKAGDTEEKARIESAKLAEYWDKQDGTGYATNSKQGVRE